MAASVAALLFGSVPEPDFGADIAHHLREERSAGGRTTAAGAEPRCAEPGFHPHCGSKVGRTSLAGRPNMPRNAEQGHPYRVALLGKNVRRRPTLPQPLGCSTIGAERLNFRVRDGTGCFPFAMAAVTLATGVVVSAHDIDQVFS